MLSVASLKAQESKTARYSPAVVAKAERVLDELGLRRSGKSILSTETVEIARTISGQARKKRELKLVHNEWKAVTDKIAAIRVEQNRLNAQYGELNLQLARVAGVDTAANNRIVGLINATNAKRNTLVGPREQLTTELSKKRAALNQDDQAKIAFRVMHANFGTPSVPTSDGILRSLDRRIEKLEQEVFSESIKLNVDGGSMYVNVVIGGKTSPMVVDSGATLISLPSEVAGDLGIDVPADAQPIRLTLADGRSISARAVTIPKVRVGEFEAENVEAAVLDASAIRAEPLLGMSFLGNFKFEIDLADKRLKLLRVAAD